MILAKNINVWFTLTSLENSLFSSMFRHSYISFWLLLGSSKNSKEYQKQINSSSIKIFSALFAKVIYVLCNLITESVFTLFKNDYNNNYSIA